VLFAAAQAPQRTGKLAGPTRTDLHGDPLPEGAVGRLGTVRLRHAGSVNALAVSPDGKLLASAGTDGGIRFWDVATGEQRPLRLRGLPGDIRALAFSPDGKALATGSWDGIVQVWDAATGEQRWRLGRFLGLVGSLAFSADGASLLIAAHNWNAVLLCDAGTGRERLRLEGFDKDFTCAALSPDGCTFALAHSERTVRKGVQLRDAATGKERLTLEGLREPVQFLAFTADAKGLVVGETRWGLGLWDPATGEKRHAFPSPDLTTVFAITLARDGRTLAAALEYPDPAKAGAFQRAVYIWDTRSGKEVRRLEWPGQGFNRLVFAADGSGLVLAGWRGSLHIWDVASGRERRPLAAHRGAVGCVAFSPDGSVLASGGADRTVRLWDVASGRPRRVLEGHRGEIAAVAFSPDGSLLASAGSWDNTLRLWDTVSGKERCPPQVFDSKALCAAFTADGKTLVAGTYGIRIPLFDPATGKVSRVLDNPGKMPVGFVALAPDGLLLALPGVRGPGTSHTVELVDARTGESRRTLQGHKAPVYGAAFSPDGRLLASSGGVVRLWEVATGQEVVAVDPDGYAGGPVAFAPAGNLVALATVDGKVRLCATHSGETLKAFRVPGQQLTPFTLAFSPDGKLLATGNQDGTVLLWDVAGLSDAARSPAVALTPAELEAYWADLARIDARKAHRAVCALAAGGQAAAAFLKARLQQVAFPSAARIEQLIADLDSARFARRQAAMTELVKIGPAAEAVVRQVRGKLSLEASRRADEVLKRFADPANFPEPLRVGRTVRALEQHGSPEARAALRVVAERAAGLSLGSEARAALKRLSP
jgi:WD40 repeat protein